MFSDDRLRTMLSSVAEDPTPSPAFVDGLWDTLARERRRPVARWQGFPLPLAATLAALMLLLLALLALSGHPNPPVLGGIVGKVDVAGTSRTLLAAGETVILGWPGHQGRIDTYAASVPGTTHAYNDVAFGPAGWWVAGPERLQPWTPTGNRGWVPAAGPTIDAHATALAVGETEIVARTSPLELSVFDTRNGALKGSLQVGATVEFAIAAGALWAVTEADQAHILRVLDLTTGRERAGPARFGPQTSIAVSPDSVWLADAAARRIFRFDPASGRQRAAVNVGLIPLVLALDPDGFVWVVGWPADASPGALIGWVDPATNAAHVRQLDLSEVGIATQTRPWQGQMFGLAVTREAAWVGLSETSFEGEHQPGPVGSSIVRVAIDRTAR